EEITPRERIAFRKLRQERDRKNNELPELKKINDRFLKFKACNDGKNRFWEILRDDIFGFETSDINFLSTACTHDLIGINLKADLSLLVGCVYRQTPELVDKDFTIKTDHSIAKSLEAASRLIQCKSFSAVVVMGNFNKPEIELEENGSPVLGNVSSHSAIVSDAISSSNLVHIVIRKLLLMMVNR
ncbi:hypothetical protein BpHYR1_003025, partial [Brachionus plicatilis]